MDNEQNPFIHADQPQPTEPTEEATQPKPLKKIPISKDHWHRFRNWYVTQKKWSIPATVLLLLLVLAALPWTRYPIGGLFIKKDVLVYTLDSKSGATIYSSFVTLDGRRPGAAGKSPYPYYFKNVSIGKHTLDFGAAYHKEVKSKITVGVGLSKQKHIQIKSDATGRLVNIRVNNKITGKAVSNIQVKVGQSATKTDWKGDGSVVVDPNLKSIDVAISGAGYNSLTTKVNINTSEVNFNQVSIVPAGRIYFLSKLSGKIDVVKTNLDGTNRQTVLAGTGKEDDQNTVLLASRDWKYLALLSRRAGSSPTLYLIDTSDDSLSTIDEGDADFSLNGWLNDNFIYTVTRNNVQLWQTGHQVIKSYGAPSKKLMALDQTAASGSGNFDYVTELIGPVYTYNDQVYYIKNWSGSFNSVNTISAKQATFNAIKADGSSKKTIRSFALAPGTQSSDVSLEEKVDSPTTTALKFSDGTKDNFYVYANGQVKDDPTETIDSFYRADYSTYLQSPSGNNTFWSEPRDGKNTLFVGDSNGQNGQQIATLSDYLTYGWYTDNYLLVSKNSSELYIMPKTGSKDPIKISDYHKPAQTFNGYGGGYGGI